MKKPDTQAKLSEGLDFHALGEALRQRRQELEMSQRELAEKAGVSQATVHHLEKNGRKVQLDTFVQVLSALQLTPTDVLRSPVDPPAIDAEWLRLIEEQNFPGLLRKIAKKMES